MPGSRGKAGGNGQEENTPERAEGGGAAVLSTPPQESICLEVRSCLLVTERNSLGQWPIQEEPAPGTLPTPKAMLRRLALFQGLG